MLNSGPMVELVLEGVYLKKLLWEAHGSLLAAGAQGSSSALAWQEITNSTEMKKKKKTQPKNKTKKARGSK